MKKHNKPKMSNNLKIVIFFIIVILIGFSIIAYILLNPVNSNDDYTEIDTSSTSSTSQDESNLEILGETATGRLVAEGAKRVKSFRTLAEAESDMGYYLGLHNYLECDSLYELVAMQSIGDNEWYQATISASHNYEVIEEAHGVYRIKLNNGTEITDGNEVSEFIADYGTGFTVKTTRTGSLDTLIYPYGEEFKTHHRFNIHGVMVDFRGYEDGKYLLAYFEVPNGKKYSIYSSVGKSSDLIVSIVTELIGNLQIMDDWTW